MVLMAGGKRPSSHILLMLFMRWLSPITEDHLKVRSTSIIGSHLHFILLIQVNRPLYIYVSRLKKGQLITLMFVGSLLKRSTMTW